MSPRDEIGALVFLNPAVTKVLPMAKVRETLSGALAVLARQGGSSTHPVRLLVMTEPPQIDENEITDKGYINERAVLERRASRVEQLYSNSADVVTTRLD